MKNEKTRKRIILARILSFISEKMIKIIFSADNPEFLNSNEINITKAGIIRFVKHNIRNKLNSFLLFTSDKLSSFIKMTPK